MGRDASDTLGPVPGTVWGATYAIAAKFQNVNFHHFEQYICTTVVGFNLPTLPHTRVTTFV